MKKILIFLTVFLFTNVISHAQVKIGDNSTSINPKSLLELESTTKGLLLPRMTNTQIAAMSGVPKGMLVFSITDSALYLRRDTGWAMLALGPVPAEKWASSGNDIYNTNSGKVGIGTTLPYSQLSNNPFNTIGSDGAGGNFNSFSWKGAQPGYVGQIYNAGPDGNSNGLAVKVAAQNAIALDVSSGVQENQGNSLLTVRGNGNTGIGTNTPQAKLDVSSTTQGVLFPRMSAAQRAAITSPVIGLMVYQTDGTKGVYHFDGAAWINLTTGSSPDTAGFAYSSAYRLTSNFAGSNTQGNVDGTGAAARFYLPAGIAVDGNGNLYIGDKYNNIIRKITPAGIVTTLAGSGNFDFSDGQGTAASFRGPQGVAVDRNGNVYVADVQNQKIRKITPGGLVTTLAGSGSSGSADGTGTAASFYYPTGVAVDAGGNVYVADKSNSKIRRITPSGAVTTLFTSSSEGIAVDGSGNIYLAEGSDIIKATSAGVKTYLTDANSDVAFTTPVGLSVDGSGNVYVADKGNHKILKVTPAGVVTTLAGNGTAGSGDGTGAGAGLNAPQGVVVDGKGNVYVADSGNNKIRKVVVR